MKTLLAAAIAASLCVSSGFAAADPVEAAFDGARLADNLTGSISDPANEVRIRLYVGTGSKISATLAPDDSTGAPIAGLSMQLVDDSGTDQQVSGGAYDKSVAGSGVVTWKKVPVPATGGYTFVVRGTSAGAWNLKLSGTAATLKATTASTTGLGVNAETQVDFQGLAAATLSFSLKAANGSKFAGELVRVVRPDGSTIDGTPAAAKGKVLLDANGVHQLVFRNTGNGLGDWTAKTTVTPGAPVARKGYVRPSGTVFVPNVSKVTPSSDFHRNDASAVTLTGRDFQPGADVRLVRNGFQDIVATGVVVDSEKQIRCTLNLATAPVTGVDSLGVWNVGVWNAPVYAMPGDPKSLVKDSPTSSTKKTFNCLSATSITLPKGVTKDTEVWQLDFNGDFQTDLNRMGLGSADSTVEGLARDAVEAYVVCFLRDVFRLNETNGSLSKNNSPPLSFVVGKVPNPAGKPGVDYNRISIGGTYETGDDRDASEPLLWGFAPLDPSNTHRDDLAVEVTDSMGITTRVGHGARTRVLDPGAPAASAGWIAATSPLRQTPLTGADRGYFAKNFAPATVGQANRYRDIVNQITRASREVAAIVAHHVGRSMGLSPGGAGPMANPDQAGNFWPANGSLDFSSDDMETLRTNSVPAALPGKSEKLIIGYFPLISTQPSNLPPSTAATAYTADWNYVGGRANAKLGDFSVKFQNTLDYGGVQTAVRGSVTVDYTRLSITNTPVYIDVTAGLPYGGISYYRISVTDNVRGGTSVFFYRLNVYPNFNMLPTSGTVFIRATDLQNYINSN